MDIPGLYDIPMPEPLPAPPTLIRVVSAKKMGAVRGPVPAGSSVRIFRRASEHLTLNRFVNGFFDVMYSLCLLSLEFSSVLFPTQYLFEAKGYSSSC